MYEKKNILYLTSTVMLTLVLFRGKTKIQKIIDKRKNKIIDNDLIDLLDDFKLLENGDMLCEVENIAFKIKKGENMFLNYIDLENLSVPSESLNIRSLTNSKSTQEKKCLKSEFKNIQEQHISKDGENHIVEHSYETIWWGKLKKIKSEYFKNYAFTLSKKCRLINNGILVYNNNEYVVNKMTENIIWLLEDINVDNNICRIYQGNYLYKNDIVNKNDNLFKANRSILMKKSFSTRDLSTFITKDKWFIKRDIKIEEFGLKYYDDNYCYREGEICLDYNYDQYIFKDNNFNLINFNLYDNNLLICKSKSLIPVDKKYFFIEIEDFKFDNKKIILKNLEYIAKTSIVYNLEKKKILKSKIYKNTIILEEKIYNGENYYIIIDNKIVIHSSKITLKMKMFFIDEVDSFRVMERNTSKYLLYNTCIIKQIPNNISGDIINSVITKKLSCNKLYKKDDLVSINEDVWKVTNNFISKS